MARVCGGSGSLKKVLDLFFKDGGVSGADVLGIDASVAADQKRDWQTEDASVGLARFCGSHHDGIVHVELLIKRANGIGTVVHGNSENLQTAITIPLLQVDEVGNFFAAGIAPCCPEVEQNDFAAISGEVKILTIRLGKGEVRCERVAGRA